MEPGGVDFGKRCFKSVGHELVDLRHEVTVHVEVQVGLLVADYLAKIGETYFICIFKLAIVLGVFLNRVVSEMDVLVGYVVEVELAAARPHVAVVVGEALQRAAYAG